MIEKEFYEYPETAKKTISKKAKERYKDKTKNPMYGKKHSKETKRKMSETRKQKMDNGEIIIWSKGKTLSELHKKRVSESTKKRWDDLTYREWQRRINSGKNNPMYGRPSPQKGRKMSEEQCLKNSISHLGQISWNKGKIGIQKHSEKARKKMREARLKRVFPTKDTSIEVLLQEGLKERGLTFEKHISVCSICQPDIVFPNQQIAIFADGDYFHSKEFKNGLVWERDRKQDKVLKENGWIPLRFWEHEINSNVENCVNEIINIVGGED